MGSETSKTKKLWDSTVLNRLQGDGIDIGCGDDPVFPQTDRFDLQHGDANEVSRFVSKKYDYVYSAHTLEHMHNPKKTIHDWYSLVKPGGHLVCIVPDEDLYEQGCFPSMFNHDHKHTFRFNKSSSWSKKSIDVQELAESLNGELISIEKQDHNYNHSLINMSTSNWSKRLFRIFMKLRKFSFIRKNEVFFAKFFRTIGAKIDQTALDQDRLAQIQFIVRKKK